MQNKLIDSAIKASENAYAPYSNFFVGASLLCKSGKIYTGCNVENVSYGGSICAERVAFCKAVSEGEREFDTLVIYCYNKNATEQNYAYPCGICRQFMSEFNQDIKIILCKKNNEKIESTETSLSKLLPNAFNF